MKVLHLIQRFPPAIGGAEAWCAGLAREQARRGHAVQVLTLSVVEEDELWDDAPRALSPVAVGRFDLDGGVRVRRCAPSATPHALVRAAERLGVRVGGRCSVELFGRALAAAREADVIHLHHCNVVLSFWGFLAARLARRPAVLTPHFHPGDQTFEQRAARWLLRRCAAVIAVSPHESALLAARGSLAARIVASTNAFDPPSFDRQAVPALRARVRAALGLQPEVALLTYVGRKTEQKELGVLVDAAALVARARDAAVVLAGPATAWYRGARAGFAAGGARFVDVPAVTEAAKRALLAASDVIVQPSSREAFGIVFLEAWAAGVPVIGAAAGAVPDVIGRAGLTFRPGDAEDLARQILQLLGRPDEGAAMAARGAARLRAAHTWAHLADAVDRAYAIARGGRSGALAPARVGEVGKPLAEEPLERREDGLG